MSSEQNDEQSRMQLWQHLDELRNRLFKVVFALGLGLIITFQFSEQLVYFLKLPILAVLPEDAQNLHFTGVADKFIFYIKVSLLAAMALVSPVILYQVWCFIAPGLYQKERKFAIPFVFLGTLSFLSGLAFCYYILLPYSFGFLINFGDPSDRAIITLDSYFSLTVKMLMGVGILFEFPMVFLLLAFMGVLEADTLVRYRRHALVVLLILSAVITPPDVISQIIVVVPLWILYELCIFGVKFVTRKRVADPDDDPGDDPSKSKPPTPSPTKPNSPTHSTSRTESKAAPEPQADPTEDSAHHECEEEDDGMGGLVDPDEPDKPGK